MFSVEAQGTPSGSPAKSTALGGAQVRTAGTSPKFSFDLAAYTFVPANASIHPSKMLKVSSQSYYARPGSSLTLVEAFIAVEYVHVKLPVT